MWGPRLAASCRDALRATHPHATRRGRCAPFATAAYTVPAQDTVPEQTLFVVGLNEGKFFGQDSAEEGLKLVEHVATASPEYTLLFGIADRDMAELEAAYPTSRGRLTPSRELEGKRLCELVPIMQAGMVDKRPRKAVGRSLKTTQNHVAYMLITHPRECLNVYWAYWRRKQYKDAAQRKFWSKHFPASSDCYFEERAHLIAIRATEHMSALRKQGLAGSTVLAVNNDVYELVVKHLSEMLGKDAAEKLNTPEFSRKLRDSAGHLCADVPDLTPLLVFLYGVMPILVFQFFFMGGQYYTKKSGLLDEVIAGDYKQRE